MVCISRYIRFGMLLLFVNRVINNEFDSKSSTQLLYLSMASTPAFSLEIIEFSALILCEFLKAFTFFFNVKLNESGCCEADVEYANIDCHLPFNFHRLPECKQIVHPTFSKVAGEN